MGFRLASKLQYLADPLFRHLLTAVLRESRGSAQASNLGAVLLKQLALSGKTLQDQLEGQAYLQFLLKERLLGNSDKAGARACVAMVALAQRMLQESPHAGARVASALKEGSTLVSRDCWYAGYLHLALQVREERAWQTLAQMLLRTHAAQAQSFVWHALAQCLKCVKLWVL
jgi:hypothetical protein